jgi:hypothetical protein
VRWPCRAVPCRRVNFFHERYFVLLEPRLLPDGSSAQAILYYQSAKQRGGKPAGPFRSVCKRRGRGGDAGTPARSCAHATLAGVIPINDITEIKERQVTKKASQVRGEL